MRIRSTVFVTGAIAFAMTSASLIAQVGPGTFADANAPSGAPDPGKLDLIWQVDPLSGALTVKIPFPTTPQGGRGPKIPFALLYNSTSTVALQGSGTTVSGGSLGNQGVSCYSFSGQSAPPDCMLTDAGKFASSNARITEQLQWAPGGTYGSQGKPGNRREVPHTPHRTQS